MATPDRAGWFRYEARVDDARTRVVQGEGADANLVVARPDGTGPQPIYTSLTVRLTPAPGSALAAGEGPAEVDDLRLYRDDTGSWE